MDRNEAIKIVKSNHPTNKQMLNDALEFLIPELKESEDKKIRKAIIESLPKYGYLPQTSIKVKDAISWLEKQGEQKPTWKPSDEQIKILDETLNFAANHESPYWNYYIFGTLNNLIRQLKKLKA